MATIIEYPRFMEFSGYNKVPRFIVEEIRRNAGTVVWVHPDNSRRLGTFDDSWTISMEPNSWREVPNPVALDITTIYNSY